LADVDGWEFVSSFSRSRQNVDTGSSKFAALPQTRPFRTRKRNSHASPIKALDNLHPLWISIGDEYANGERLTHNDLEDAVVGSSENGTYIPVNENYCVLSFTPSINELSINLD
jgi:hypothetical protein